MSVNIWWAVGAAWAGGCLGFVFGCWWASACALNALGDRVIANEHQKAERKTP